MKKIITIGLLWAIASTLTYALPNPASVNCAKQGYKSVILKNKGICVFPDNTYCEEWAFFRGECKPGVNRMPPSDE